MKSPNFFVDDIARAAFVMPLLLDENIFVAVDTKHARLKKIHSRTVTQEERHRERDDNDDNTHSLDTHT